MLITRIASRVVRHGRLTIVDADGSRHTVDGGTPPAVTIRLHDRSLARRLALQPQLQFGEAYMNGTLTIEEGGLHDLLEILVRATPAFDVLPLARLAGGIARALRRLHQLNDPGRARRNVAHHYDLSARLYDLFLDRERLYSCAYFGEPHADLERAQRDKMRLLARKLLLRPGQRVLDIGSGWGALALHLARSERCEVTGITLSEEQLAASRARAEREGQGQRVRFHLRDFREEAGRYDRIVSVGMFEHVGVANYGAFFARLRALLADDGVAVLHAIGRMSGPDATNAWIRKYIFPGGYIPALSEVLAAVERERLWVADIEILRLHYAMTLRLWYERFQANRAEVAAIYDERFCRMWEFYLAASEAMFRHGDLMVFQMQLARRRDAVPLTRAYLVGPDRPEARGRLTAAE